MHGLKPQDKGRVIDWGKTSADYADYRPGPPASFYERLAVLGVGLPGQRVLDLGTGTGVLARQFARRGAAAAGIDISEEQIAAAKSLALDEGLVVDFQTAAAEETPFPDAAFDVLTANQCWLYFDLQRMIPEARRLLAEPGLLVTAHFCWLPLEDRIAAASERLVLEFNPDWTAAGWAGTVPSCPDWAKDDFNLRAMFYYDVPVRFTRETWRGRFRACRGVGAALSAEEIEQFDAEHDQLLQEIAAEEFSVLHRIDAHLLEFK